MTALLLWSHFWILWAVKGDSSTAANEKEIAGDAGELLVLLEGRVRVEVQEQKQKRLFLRRQSLEYH
jgi:hypothetical protein